MQIKQQVVIVCDRDGTDKGSPALNSTTTRAELNPPVGPEASSIRSLHVIKFGGRPSYLPAMSDAHL